VPQFLVTARSATHSSAGGKPLGDPARSWPICSRCHGPLQYLATISVGEDGAAAAQGDKLLLLFQCQQHPGMCEEWSAASGGNAVLQADADDALPLVPPGGLTYLPTRNPLSFVAIEEPADADRAADQYYQALAAPDRGVVGKAGGGPVWVQYDETPTCSCGRVMRFIAQLEETAAPGLNFGGGTAYVFRCDDCEAEARFLWQC